MFSHVAWYLFLVRYSHFVSSESGGDPVSAFPLPRILLVKLPCLYFLPAYWANQCFIKPYEWQIFTVYQSIIPQYKFFSEPERLSFQFHERPFNGH